MYDDFDKEIMFWMGLCLTSIIWIRPTLIKRKTVTILEAPDAITMTEILPGKKGRVIYEGCSWQAYCVDRQMAIAANYKVYVLRREGNTLIVASEDFF